MNKWLLVATATIGGVGLGIIIAVTLIEKLVPFCPACGGRLSMREDSLVCTSCGASLPLKKPST